MSVLNKAWKSDLTELYSGTANFTLKPIEYFVAKTEFNNTVYQDIFYIMKGPLEFVVIFDAEHISYSNYLNFSSTLLYDAPIPADKKHNLISVFTIGINIEVSSNDLLSKDSNIKCNSITLVIWRIPLLQLIWMS